MVVIDLLHDKLSKKMTRTDVIIGILQVKVRRRGSETKFIAKVLAQGPECDIGTWLILYITCIFCNVTRLLNFWQAK